MANAKKTVDAWKAKRDKAERALRKAVKRYNEAPDDSTQEQLTAIGKAMSAAQVRLQEVYDKLPYSLDDDAGEVAAQEWHDEMVAEVAIEQRKHLTSEQVAEVVNRYLSNRHALVVVEYEKRFNRHEWEIQETVSYGIPHEHEPAHQEILGRIWVDDLSEAGKVIGVNFGYGLAKGELRLLNQGRLAIIMRGVLRVIDKEFRLPDESEDKPVKKKPIYDTPTSRPGRPQTDGYKWARRELAKGKDVEDVYWEWSAKGGWEHTSILKRNFRKAMRYKPKT